jgi:predicted lipid-binding transport protein (Tim44 family)
MKRFLMLLTIALTCMSLLSTTAEARRLGGGGSFGKQRTVAPQQAQSAPTAAPTPAPAAAPAAAKSGNKWLGPLAGLAIGAGLASMFAGGGLGGAMGPILLAILAAVVVMFLIGKFSKPKRPAMQYAGGVPSYDIPQYNSAEQQPVYGSNAPASAVPVARNIPHDFPMESFLRGAKTSFIRLQAANDRKDLDDIREFTTPEIFAEISMQLLERGNVAQKTDVININCELLEAVNEGDLSIASVRFTGQLSENNGTPEFVDEIWHVQRNLLDPKSGWLLAGIQQTTIQ